MTPPEECLIDRWSDCQPAKLHVALETIDAGVFPVLWIVRPIELGVCELTYFIDYSGDPFKGDYGDLAKRACAGLDVTAHDPSSGTCAGWSGVDCETVEEWYLPAR